VSARVAWVAGGVVLITLVALAVGVLVRLAATHQPPGDGMTVLGSVPRDTDAADRAVLDQLRKAGSDLSRPTDVTYYLYVPAERDARTAAALLQRRGFKTDVEPPLRNSSEAASNDWGVIALKMEVPSLETLRTTRMLFLSLAKKYDGIYDGWEASVVK
jgi:hypothetical protein